MVSVTYKGKRFVKDMKNGYYHANARIDGHPTTLLLHRVVWEDNNGKIDQGTQSEQTTDNRGNSTMEDMSENVDDAVDDLEDKARDATPGGESRNTSRDSSAKSQND